MKKRFLIFTVCLIAALCFVCGCGGAESKTFEKAGMQITLTDDFYEKDLVSQTAYYESRNALVTALKEEFSAVAGFSDYSLNDYTDIIIKQNKLTAEKISREGKDYIYFTYEKSVSGKDYFYLATTHKAGDAFWLIQFACEVSNKDSYTEKFLNWADSITFSSADSTSPDAI